MYQPFEFDPNGATGAAPNNFPTADVVGVVYGVENVYGGDGNDKIWTSLYGDTMLAVLTKGGNGSDSIYGGFGEGTDGFIGTQRHAGGAHKDLIDMTYWYDDPGLAAFLGTTVDALPRA